jgi:hypothetical protein
MRTLLTAALFSLLLIGGAQAQTPAPRVVNPPCNAPCTQQQLLQDVQNQFPDNTAGAITPAIMRTFFNNQLNSMMAASPLVAGQLVCWNGTTGLPGTCSGAVSIPQGGTGAVSQGGAAINIFPTAIRAGDIAYWSGANWVTLTGNNTGTQLLSENASGVPSWVPAVNFPVATRVGDIIYWSGTSWVTLAGNNAGNVILSENASGAPTWLASGNAASTVVLPAPTRAGDMPYWNGTAWTTIAGNNTGTQFLSQNGSGVPAWGNITAVTSVTCGTGLSGGTITATGTCAVNISNFTNSLAADQPLNVIGNYFPGPSVAQGTTGTWWAAGTVTLSDTAAATFYCKLWDTGAIIMASGVAQITAAGNTTMSLAGYVSSPAGNITISCRDITTANGNIRFNISGNSRDSTLNVMRIQ